MPVHVAAYDYVISFEHADPVMSPEDGAEKAIEYLKPLMIKKAADDGVLACRQKNDVLH